LPVFVQAATCIQGEKESDSVGGLNMRAGHVTCVGVPEVGSYVRSVGGSENPPEVESPGELRPEIGGHLADFLANGASRTAARDAELLIRIVASAEIPAQVALELTDRIAYWVRVAGAAP
jgi:hypothetical protein